MSSDETLEDDLDDLIDANPNADDEAFSSLVADRPAEDPDLADKLFSDDLVEKHLDGIEPDATAGMFHVQEPTYAQPVNRATMVCLRGPCVHHWAMMARYVGPGEDIHLKKIRQCNCHTEETGLSGQNIYDCSQWWPVWLAWVPVSLRGALRPKLNEFYEAWLRRSGYDFAWKKWPDDLFESDRPDLRDKAGLGGKRLLLDGTVING